MADVKAGGAYVELSLQTEGFTKGLALAERRLQKLASSVATFGKAFAAVGAVGAAAFIPAIKAASDFQETMSKFDVVFGDQSDNMRAFADVMAQELGRSRSQIASFLASSQDLFVPIGFDQAAAIELSQTLTRLAVDLASFNNVADADALRDLQAALTGSGETMKKYGVIVSEAAVKQQLLNQSLNPSTATEQEKVMARLTLILNGTTAAQGDAVRTADSFANQMKRLQGELNNLGVTLGSAVLPKLTEFVSDLASAVRSSEDFIESNSGLVIGLAALAAGASVAGLAVIGLSGAMTALSSVLGVVSGLITFVGGAVAALSTPVLVAVAAVGVLITVFAEWRSTLGSLGSSFSTTFGVIKDAIAKGDLAAAAKFAFKGVVVVVLDAMNLILSSIKNALRTLQNAPVIGLTPIGWMAGNIADQIEGAMGRATESIEAVRNEMNAYAESAQKAAEASKGVGDAAAKAAGKGAPTGGGDAAGEALIEAEKAQQRALDELNRRGQQTFDNTRTASERYAITLKELNEQLESGVIDHDTYGRAAEQASRALLDATGVTERKKEAERQAQEVISGLLTDEQKYANEFAKLNLLRSQGLLTVNQFNAALNKAKGELDSNNEAMQDGKRIFDETRTAQEKYQLRLDKLNSLLKQGAIDQQTFDRAVTQADKDLELATADKRSQDISGRIPTQLSTFGGQRAAQIFGASDTIAKQSLTIQKQTLDETKRTRQILERGQLVFGA